MRGIWPTVYLVPAEPAGTVFDDQACMLNSQRGKAASEWSAWILAYEHTLRSKYCDIFVNRLDLDLHQLRLRCELGEDPIATANADVIPLMSNRSRARVALERQRILDDLAHMRAERRSRAFFRACLALAVLLAAGFGYLSYNNLMQAAEIRAADQAHIEWRQSIGLR